MYYVYICSSGSSSISSESRWDSRGCNIPIYTHKRKCYFNACVRGVHPPASNHPPTNAGLNGSRVRANHPVATPPRSLCTHTYIYIYILETRRMAVSGARRAAIDTVPGARIHTVLDAKAATYIYSYCIIIQCSCIRRPFSACTYITVAV